MGNLSQVDASPKPSFQRIHVVCGQHSQARHGSRFRLSLRVRHSVTGDQTQAVLTHAPLAHRHSLTLDVLRLALRRVGGGVLGFKTVVNTMHQVVEKKDLGTEHGFFLGKKSRINTTAKLFCVVHAPHSFASVLQSD